MSGRQLDETQVRHLVEEYEAGVAVVELAARLGASRQTVQGILKQRGVPTRMNALKPVLIDEMARLYEAGWTLAKIGKHMQVSPEGLRPRLLERGVRMRPRGEKRR